MRIERYHPSRLLPRVPGLPSRMPARRRRPRDLSCRRPLLSDGDGWAWGSSAAGEGEEAAEAVLATPGSVSTISSDDEHVAKPPRVLPMPTAVVVVRRALGVLPSPRGGDHGSGGVEGRDDDDDRRSLLSSAQEDAAAGRGRSEWSSGSFAAATATEQKTEEPKPAKETGKDGGGGNANASSGATAGVPPEGEGAVTRKTRKDPAAAAPTWGVVPQDGDKVTTGADLEGFFTPPGIFGDDSESATVEVRSAGAPPHGTGRRGGAAAPLATLGTGTAREVATGPPTEEHTAAAAPPPADAAAAARPPPTFRLSADSLAGLRISDPGAARAASSVLEYSTSDVLSVGSSATVDLDGFLTPAAQETPGGATVDPGVFLTPTAEGTQAGAAVDPDGFPTPTAERAPAAGVSTQEQRTTPWHTPVGSPGRRDNLASADGAGPRGTPAGSPGQRSYIAQPRSPRAFPVIVTPTEHGDVILLAPLEGAGPGPPPSQTPPPLPSLGGSTSPREVDAGGSGTGGTAERRGWGERPGWEASRNGATSPRSEAEQDGGTRHGAGVRLPQEQSSTDRQYMDTAEIGTVAHGKEQQESAGIPRDGAERSPGMHSLPESERGDRFKTRAATLGRESMHSSPVTQSVDAGVTGAELDHQDCNTQTNACEREMQEDASDPRDSAERSLGKHNRQDDTLEDAAEIGAVTPGGKLERETDIGRGGTATGDRPITRGKEPEEDAGPGSDSTEVRHDVRGSHCHRRGEAAETVEAARGQERGENADAQSGQTGGTCKIRSGQGLTREEAAKITNPTQRIAAHGEEEQGELSQTKAKPRPPLPLAREDSEFVPSIDWNAEDDSIGTSSTPFGLFTVREHVVHDLTKWREERGIRELQPSSRSVCSEIKSANGEDRCSRLPHSLLNSALDEEGADEEDGAGGETDPGLGSFSQIFSRELPEGKESDSESDAPGDYFDANHPQPELSEDPAAAATAEDASESSGETSDYNRDSLPLTATVKSSNKPWSRNADSDDDSAGYCGLDLVTAPSMGSAGESPTSSNGLSQPKVRLIHSVNRPWPNNIKPNDTADGDSGSGLAPIPSTEHLLCKKQTTPCMTLEDIALLSMGSTEEVTLPAIVCRDSSGKSNELLDVPSKNELVRLGSESSRTDLEDLNSFWTREWTEMAGATGEAHNSADITKTSVPENVGSGNPHSDCSRFLRKKDVGIAMGDDDQADLGAGNEYPAGTNNIVTDCDGNEYLKIRDISAGADIYEVIEESPANDVQEEEQTEEKSGRDQTWERGGSDVQELSKLCSNIEKYHVRVMSNESRKICKTDRASETLESTPPLALKISSDTLKQSALPGPEIRSMKSSKKRYIHIKKKAIAKASKASIETKYNIATHLEERSNRGKAGACYKACSDKTQSSLTFKCSVDALKTLDTIAEQEHPTPDVQDIDHDIDALKTLDTITEQEHPTPDVQDIDHDSLEKTSSVNADSAMEGENSKSKPTDSINDTQAKTVDSLAENKRSTLAVEDDYHNEQEKNCAEPLNATDLSVITEGSCADSIDEESFAPCSASIASFASLVIEEELEKGFLIDDAGKKDSMEKQSESKLSKENESHNASKIKALLLSKLYVENIHLAETLASTQSELEQVNRQLMLVTMERNNIIETAGVDIGPGEQEQDSYD